MRVFWDENKNQENIKKHKISFEYAKQVFEDPCRLVKYDSLHSINEDRFIVIGKARNEVVLFVSEVEINDDDVRIISARKADKKEKEEYDGRL
ncbi:hypothetical protein FACS1894172_20000 [Spirochaetia bacterium]|nr:hypothetical protein FACS1894172_20000 [Spirochaetia bacterium]